MALLEIQQLGFERDEQLVFAPVSFELHSGQILQVLGPNGVGKTTLLKLLATLLTPACGSVLWQGQPISQVSEAYLHSLYYLGHKVAVTPELSAWENLAFLAKLGNMPGDLARALSAVQLAPLAERLCREMSAGQQRRVALATLWLTQARLWILDEPFTALDVQACARLAKQLQAHALAGGMVIFTSHQQVDFTALAPETLTLQVAL